MKHVVRKLEGVSQTLSNNGKQLVNLVGHSKDMDGKIEAILEMMNNTRQAKPRRFSKYKSIQPEGTPISKVGCA